MNQTPSPSLVPRSPTSRNRCCRSLLGPITLALSLTLVAGCGDDGEDVASPDALPAAITVSQGAFRDELGRQVLLRGYNARVEGIFDVTFDDGRIPLEYIPPFAEEDARRFEELGFNVLRLTVNWSGLEPQPLQYNEAYMQRIDAVLRLARAHHFYVLIDMHQDAYSKEIGEDGAPLWAITPPPEMLLQGPLTDLADRRLSMQALAAGINFYANENAQDGRPLHDAFVAAVQQLVRRYRDDPTVAGYEAFNEPIVFNDQLLDAFHERFADGVHALDPDAAIFFEPDSLRNLRDSAPIPKEPWSKGPGVYSPHIYTTVFSQPLDSWASENPADLTASMERAAREAQAWGVPLFVGEFGIDQTIERGHRYLEAELNLQDRFLASSAVWVWREAGQWGLREEEGAERPATVGVVSRPYPRAVAGDLLAIERPDAQTLRVRYRATPALAGEQHEVSASADFAANFEVRCDGIPTSFTRRTGRIELKCPDGGTGEHTFEVRGVDR